MNVEIDNSDAEQMTNAYRYRCGTKKVEMIKKEGGNKRKKYKMNHTQDEGRKEEKDK